MVRRISYDPYRYEQLDAEARSRRYRVNGYKRWIDPFPGVHGTVPEKMVYEQLTKRGIPFYFLNDFTYTIPEIEFVKEYQSDFVLPHLKLIIEVQGAFWHSKPKTIESDAFKFAVYEATGWKAVAWWDYDILENVNRLFAAEPLLAGYSNTNVTRLAELTPVSRKKADTSQGIRTLNYRRAQRLQYKKKPVSIKKIKVKGYSTYAAR